MDTTCVVITRFDIATPFLRRHDHITRDMDAYRAERMPVMESTLLPSLLNQTDTDFTWLILSEDCENLKHLERDSSPRIVVSDCGAPSGKTRHQAVGEICSGPLLSIRVDSDDLLHQEHIARVKFSASEGKVIAFVRGYTYDLASGLVYEYPASRLEDHPFSILALSSSSPGADIYGLGAHQKIRPDVKLRFPGWMRTINGHNLSDKKAHRIDGNPVSIDLSEYGL